MVHAQIEVEGRVPLVVELHPGYGETAEVERRTLLICLIAASHPVVLDETRRIIRIGGMVCGLW